MLLHLRPRFYSPYKNVELIDYAVEPLGLRLTQKELASHRPYINHFYKVACRRSRGNKATDGILIETPDVLDEFHATARWAVEASVAVTHRVHYKILDRDFDAASDDMTLWYASLLETGNGTDIRNRPIKWQDRWPAWAGDERPVHAQPVMEIEPPGHERPNTTDVIDDATGWIMSRSQTFEMPTLERGRILQVDLRDRMPSLEMTFRL